MAQEMNEIDQIVQHIEKGEHFLLSGGAGSGKTYTLVEVIKRIYDKTPKASVACITYTNVAAIEVRDRAPFENLWVSTIHDFLWSTISPYQHNLKKCLIELVSYKKINSTLEVDELKRVLSEKNIQYREWIKLKEGIISHDEVITLAEHMFSKYSLLRKVVTDKYEFVFIDEYQDTFPNVIKIFLNIFKKMIIKVCLGYLAIQCSLFSKKGLVKLKIILMLFSKLKRRKIEDVQQVSLTLQIT